MRLVSASRLRSVASTANASKIASRARIRGGLGSCSPARHRALQLTAARQHEPKSPTRELLAPDLDTEKNRRRCVVLAPPTPRGVPWRLHEASQAVGWSRVC